MDIQKIFRASPAAKMLAQVKTLPTVIKVVTENFRCSGPNNSPREMPVKILAMAYINYENKRC